MIKERAQIIHTSNQDSLVLSILNSNHRARKDSSQPDCTRQYANEGMVVVRGQGAMMDSATAMRSVIHVMNTVTQIFGKGFIKIDLIRESGTGRRTIRRRIRILRYWYEYLAKRIMLCCEVSVRLLEPSVIQHLLNIRTWTGSITGGSAETDGRRWTSLDWGRGRL